MKEMPHRDVYRKIDSSMDSFFLKRQYTQQNFNFLLNVLAEQNKLEQVPKVLQKMNQLSIVPNEATYNYMIKAAANAGDIKQAEHFFSLYKKQFSVSKQIYTSLMLAYVNARDNVMAQRIVMEMKENGLVPDIAVLTTLMNAHLKSRNLQKCWELHKLVQKQGYLMDQSYIGVLMLVYASSHDAQKAIKLYKQHIEKSDTEPLIETRNSFLKALAGRPDYAENALQEFFKMISSGVLINSGTILYALRACAEAKDVKSAVQVIKIMRHKGIKPNKFIYNGIIRCYAAGCSIPNLRLDILELFINDSWRILEQISRAGLMDVKILNNFLYMYVCALKSEEIEGLVLPLYDKHQIEKDQYTYEYLLKLFSTKQDMVTFTRIWQTQMQYLEQKRKNLLEKHGPQRLIELDRKEEYRPTFNAINMYLESGIKLMRKQVIVEALQMLKKMKRMPKPKHLKFLGELKDLPIEIQAELVDFKLRFGAIRGNHKKQPAIQDPQNL